MPRTAKSKAKSRNITVKSCDASKNTTRKPKNDIKNEKWSKNELVANAPKGTIIEKVFHRKSERRRVARDIFLVFEESNTRKKRSNKKQTKSKFGHLKVEDQNKPKGLLRDIKNVSKCYLTSSAISVNPALPVSELSKKKVNSIITVKKEKNVQTEKILASASKSVNSNFSNKTTNKKPLKISTLETQPSTFETDQTFVARVNPIFLWVKQDNTRIVEVRCEDYDKRNRIRITKTSNGWRAIPRSDPTTSRVLKFYSTPLMKVKRETNHETNNNLVNKIESEVFVACKDFSLPDIFTRCVVNEMDTKSTGNDTVCNPIALKNSNIIKKKARKIKNKSHFKKTVAKSVTSATADAKTAENTENLTTPINRTKNSAEMVDVPVYINTRLESAIDIELTYENQNCIKDLDDNIPVRNVECNTKELEIIKNKPSIAISLESEPANCESKKQCFYLCPKTGLFLPNELSECKTDNNVNRIAQNIFSSAENSFLSSIKGDFNNVVGKPDLDSEIQITEENTESLEAKTKNLKDLLDDADLLQNCDDNTNSDADLIDTLVKSSCETNLIQESEVITEANMQDTNEMVVQLIANVSDPPKCLSFNEAGEIEGVNGELFQSNTYIEPFEKQSEIMTEPNALLHSTSSVVAALKSSQKMSTYENIEPILENINEIEDSPKDLSYKKREEVCPPSESRSQCAVTSSSDIIKSSQEETSSLASSSDTLKNLILEQFIKLNALTTKHQKASIELEKHHHSDIINIKSAYTSKSSKSNNFIETVVIEDDENVSYIEHEEPLKKRIRLFNTAKIVRQNMGKFAMIDKDPDPLTQLRLLIGNTQWKVPDPILVPKDRLSAVLASPAREIPLLITTRPELRLPDAFAYPEIIQNPNILVISMAQLEAILKNEPDVEKTTTMKSMKAVGDQIDVLHDLQMPSQKLRHTPQQPNNILTSANNNQETNKISLSRKDVSESLSETIQQHPKISHPDSSPSDINSTTMSMLNQMLWLPYFGQLSKDIGKSPIALPEKCANIVPFYNAGLKGVSNLEDISKNTTTNKLSSKFLSNNDIQTFQQQYNGNEELSLFQKIVHHQMHSVLQLNQLKADSSQVKSSIEVNNPVTSIEKSKSKIKSSNFTEQRNLKALLSNKQTYTSICKNPTNKYDSNIVVQEKSYNLRSSVAGRHSAESKQYINNNRKEIIDNKPRLTCKSLSNLLEPEHGMLPSLRSSIPLPQNLSSEFVKSVSEIKRSSTECGINESHSEQKGQFLCNTSNIPPSHRSFSIESSGDQKQKPKTQEIHHSGNDTHVLTTDSNVPLWHPLFGSNTKTAYSSPWQWTTVTASGE